MPPTSGVSSASPASGAWPSGGARAEGRGNGEGGDLAAQVQGLDDRAQADSSGLAASVARHIGKGQHAEAAVHEADDVYASLVQTGDTNPADQARVEGLIEDASIQLDHFEHVRNLAGKGAGMAGSMVLGTAGALGGVPGAMVGAAAGEVGAKRLMLGQEYSGGEALRDGALTGLGAGVGGAVGQALGAGMKAEVSSKVPSFVSRYGDWLSEHASHVAEHPFFAKHPIVKVGTELGIRAAGVGAPAGLAAGTVMGPLGEALRPGALDGTPGQIAERELRAAAEGAGEGVVMGTVAGGFLGAKTGTSLEEFGLSKEGATSKVAWKQAVQEKVGQMDEAHPHIREYITEKAPEVVGGSVGGGRGDAAAQRAEKPE